MFMLCLSVCLVGLSLYHLWQGSTPEFIPVIMLMASLTLVSGFSLALYRIKPLHRITVVMLDGSTVTLLRKKKSVAVELLDGLTDAMDWHRPGSIEIDAQRASRMRQGVAQGRQQQSHSQSRRFSPGRLGEQYHKAVQAVASWISHARSRRSEAARPAKMSSEQSTVEAQVRQASYKGAGPVVALKEVTLGARLKVLLGWLRAMFSR